MLALIVSRNMSGVPMVVTGVQYSVVYIYSIIAVQSDHGMYSLKYNQKPFTLKPLINF